MVLTNHSFLHCHQLSVLQCLVLDFTVGIAQDTENPVVGVPEVGIRAMAQPLKHNTWDKVLPQNFYSYLHYHDITLHCLCVLITETPFEISSCHLFGEALYHINEAQAALQGHMQISIIGMVPPPATPLHPLAAAQPQPIPVIPASVPPPASKSVRINIMREFDHTGCFIHKFGCGGHRDLVPTLSHPDHQISTPDSPMPRPSQHAGAAKRHRSPSVTVILSDDEDTPRKKHRVHPHTKYLSLSPMPSTSSIAAYAMTTDGVSAAGPSNSYKVNPKGKGKYVL
ncbi:hypothetical protein K439DRAFT_1614269 [Ramaria rubella]|nr:hypothetical protein K439DRAFT_1614269 [Ramaria rubella]